MIEFSSPDDKPHGCFHPDSRRGFSDEEGYWSSVGIYCRAQALASPEDRQKLRRVYDPALLAAAAADLALAPDWKERRTAVLKYAVFRCFEANLRNRAILLATGGEAIVARISDSWLGTGADGRGENALGRALEEARARLALRAADVDAVQCEHQDASKIERVCMHLLDATLRRHRRFSGVACAYDVVCDACASGPREAMPLRRVCSACRGGPDWGGDIGYPEIRVRPSSVRFEHRLVSVHGLAPEDVRAIAAVRGAADWLVLDGAGRVCRVDLATRAVEGTVVVPGRIDLAVPVDLHVAPRGELAAVTEIGGRQAVIFEPHSGRLVMELQRDEAHPDVCRFPFAFFEHEARLLVVHATAWNRLEISDPRTGELLTTRAPTSYRGGEPQPEHYLDYFHAGLCVSPDGRWMLDNGWVWQPTGVVRTFSLERWLRENPWESEDGPSVRDLCWRDLWDLSACWLSDRVVALWGVEESEDTSDVLPGARLFDVTTGTELRSFIGPENELTWDPPYLVGHNLETGASVWDAETGERVCRDDLLRPSAYHPDLREFVTFVAGEGFRVSRRVDD